MVNVNVNVKFMYRFDYISLRQKLALSRPTINYHR